MPPTDKPSLVRTSETTFDIVDALSTLDRTSMSDISSHLEISPSTAHRHLNTLVNRGYATKENGEFHLGTQFLTKGGLVRRRKHEYQWTEDYVRKLARETNERAQFEIEEGGQRVFLFRRAGEDAIREKSAIGKRGPMHSSAAGKAILAEYSDEKLREIIATHGLRAVTENTITDESELFSEIETVRERGFATNFEESQLGYNAIGVSVSNVADEVVGAFSVSGPSYRLDEETMLEEMYPTISDVVQEYELFVEFNTDE